MAPYKFFEDCAICDHQDRTTVKSDLLYVQISMTDAVDKRHHQIRISISQFHLELSSNQRRYGWKRIDRVDQECNKSRKKQIRVQFYFYQSQQLQVTQHQFRKNESKFENEYEIASNAKHNGSLISAALSILESIRTVESKSEKALAEIKENYNSIT